MEQCLSVMSEEYKRKNYAKGVFASIQKKTSKNSFGVYIFFGIVLAGCAFGVKWALDQIEGYRLSGQKDLIGTGYFIAAFFGIFALISLAVIVITIMRHARGAEKWKQLCAKESGCTAADMDEFERQTMNEECRAVKLLGAAAALAAGQSDGILTKDYIYLADAHHVILKLSDLSAACLVQQTVRVGETPARKNINYLTVMLLSKSGSRSIAECSREAGAELIRHLKERVPELYTAEGEVISAGDFDRLGQV